MKKNTLPKKKTILIYPSMDDFFTEGNDYYDEHLPEKTKMSEATDYDMYILSKALESKHSISAQWFTYTTALSPFQCMSNINIYHRMSRQ